MKQFYHQLSWFQHCGDALAIVGWLKRMSEHVAGIPEQGTSKARISGQVVQAQV